MPKSATVAGCTSNHLALYARRRAGHWFARRRLTPRASMTAFLLSTLAVAVAEIGGKTQLLALVLAARFRRPLPIIAGILVATLGNHALASALGAWAGGSLDHSMLRWAVGLSFLGMALWMLVPD